MYTTEMFRHVVLEVALGEDKTLTKTMGEKIQMYRDTVGIGPGTNWCVAFVYWCHEQASWLLNTTNPMYKTASTSALYNYAKNYGLLVESPAAGDIYISSNKHHTGMIREDNPDHNRTKTRTIEGNTWVGDHVWGIHKRKKDLAGAFFIRL